MATVQKIFLFTAASVLLFGAFMPADAFAEEVVFGELIGTGWEIFGGMRKLIFASAGFGIIAVVVGALFGALNWKWLAAIIVGVVVIAATVSLVGYMTAGTGADVTVKGITDTLTSGE